MADWTPKPGTGPGIMFGMLGAILGLAVAEVLRSVGAFLFMLIGFLAGYQAGAWLFTRRKLNSDEEAPGMLWGHRLPRMTREGDYDDAFIRRVMEVYHPGELLDEDGEDEPDDEESDESDEESEESEEMLQPSAEGDAGDDNG